MITAFPLLLHALLFVADSDKPLQSISSEKISAWSRRSGMLEQKLKKLDEKLLSVNPRSSSAFELHLAASSLLFDLEQMELSQKHLSQAWNCMNSTAEAQLLLIERSLKLPDIALKPTFAVEAQQNLRSQLREIVDSKKISRYKSLVHQTNTISNAWYFRLLMNIAYQEKQYNPSADLDLLQQVARKVAPAVFADERKGSLVKRKIGKLKVGFLSVFFKEHSIGKVLGPVVATLAMLGKFHVTLFTMDQTGLDEYHHALETPATDLFASHCQRHVHLSQSVSVARDEIKNYGGNCITFTFSPC
jgi:predicted O-linked N-acetylglucosamine transferase (SPINDLY family)